MQFPYLNPATTQISTAPDGTLRVVVDGDCCADGVEVLRAFPLRHAAEYIVLRDSGGRQIGVLRRLDDFDAATRALLEERLRAHYFLPQISAIRGVHERFGSSVWDMETNRGPCSASMGPINEALTEVEPGRFLLTDVEGTRYEIRNLDALDATSRALFLGKR